MNSLPVSLYVHIPWCVRKCPYCDFNSHEGRDPAQEDQYVDQLIVDLESDLQLLPEPTSFRSVFFGGGTPSLFKPGSIQRILEAAHQHAGLAEDVEVTLEANPGAIDREKFEGYLAAGVNRLSIGIQSFSDASLAALGRIHSSNDAATAIERARGAGFENLNLDLMHGLPNQTIKGAMDDLDRAIAFQPDHISWYQLTIEPNTVFFSSTPVLPDDETCWEIQSEGERLLSASGFSRYEVSAFAQPGSRSAHNLNYWHFGDYVGIGAGAHGKLTTGSVERTRKTRSPADYLKAVNRKSERVPDDALPAEFLMNALRLVDGFPLELFEQTTGLDRSNLAPFIERASTRGLIAVKDDWLAPTEQGARFLNDLLLLAD